MINNLLSSFFNPAQTAIVIIVAVVGVILIVLNVVLAYIFNKRGERKLYDMILQHQRELLMQQLDEMKMGGAPENEAQQLDMQPFFASAQGVAVQPEPEVVEVAEPEIIEPEAVDKQSEVEDGQQLALEEVIAACAEDEDETAEDDEDDDESEEASEEEELESTEEVDVSEMSEVTKTALGIAAGTVGGKYTLRIFYSFRAKLALSGDEVKARYIELENEIATYIKVKTSISKKHERVYKGRETLAMLLFRGKKLCATFALNPEDYADTKYRGKDVGGVKRFEKTPMMLKLTSDRKVKYAKYLLEQLALKYGLERVQPAQLLSEVESATKDELIERGEIIITGERVTAEQQVATVAEAIPEPERAATVVEEQPEVVEVAEPEIIEPEVVEEQPEIADEEVLVDREFEILEEVAAEDVSVAMSDEKAEQLMEDKIIKKRVVTAKKKGIVNIDSLSRNFEAGAHVTIEKLRDMQLIAKDVTVLKVLAKGTLNKPLIVEAEDFSLEAVKMIVLTGGRVIRRKFKD